MKKSLQTLVPLAVMAVAGAGGLMLARAGATTLPESSLASLAGPGPRKNIDITRDVFRGTADATVVMIEYSDFQCPFCIQFATTVLPKIEHDYVDAGNVRLAFRNFPLISLHAQAQHAAELVECAKRQGRLWETHDLLFGAAGKLNAEVFSTIARKASLDRAVTDACVKSDAKPVVDEQVRQAISLGINSTPTVLLGLVRSDGTLSLVYTLTGAKSEGTVRRALDDLVLEASSHKTQ